MSHPPSDSDPTPDGPEQPPGQQQPPPGPWHESWQPPPPPGYYQGYSPQGWAGPGYVGNATPAPPTSGRATAAVVLGALSLMACMGFVTGIPAMIIGASARREIRESQGRLSGDGVALGGIIAGAAGTALSLLAIGVFVLLLILGADITVNDTGDPGVSTTGALP